LRLALAPDAALIINDAIPLAMSVGAHAVHLGQGDWPAADARRWLPSRIAIGVSTHSDAEIALALTASPAYLGFGCLFDTPSKTAVARNEPAAAAAAETTTGLPVFGIGGITTETVEIAAAAGVTRVAVGAGIWNASDPAAAAAAILRALGA
jgi:thiamine-phosphate pyrophosphorylase